MTKPTLPASRPVAPAAAMPDKADVKVGAVNFDLPIRGFDKKPIEGPEKPGGPDVVLTLKTVCVQALSSVFEDDKGMSGKEKNERASLALMIYEDRLLVPSLEQKNLLKEVIGKAYPPLVVMRAWEILDPAEAEKLNS